MDEDKIFEKLNEEQKAAAAHITGPCYIIAGPGSGKTSTLVRKIAYAIKNGVEPKHILIFTFTRKAAKEIKDRVLAYVGTQAEAMTIGTYHSVCARILRRYADKLGLTNDFTILDQEDSLSILNQLCKDTNLNAKSMLSYISQQKRKIIYFETAVKNAVGVDEKRAAIYRDYEMRLHKQNSLDFDNLILYTVMLLVNFPDVRTTLHNKYRFIYCDETQDSSDCDLYLISLLINQYQNITVILDDDQSIYNFRGANVQSVLKFRESLNNPSLFILKRNYRSSQTIVNASCSLINKNTCKIQKDLFSKNDVGDKIILAEEKSTKAETTRILSFIQLMHQEKGQYKLPYKEIAVLYRTNNFAQELEKVLLANSIPYEICGNLEFYSRKEIKDLMSYLKFAHNYYDYEAFKRIVNLPKRGIGQAALNKIQEYLEEEHCDILEACKIYITHSSAKAGAKKFQAFVDIIETLHEVYMYAPPQDALRYLIEQLDFVKHLESAHKDNYAERIEYIDQLIALAENYSSLQEMVEETSLDYLEEENSDKVKLMTIHSAKGLEYDCVIIGGCNEEVIPFVRAIEEDNIEEERRLFYVAMTRARKYLFLTRSKNTLIGNHFKHMKVSRFINEIDQDYIFSMNAQ